MCRVTVGFNIASATIVLSNTLAGPYADVGIIINAFVTNVMATRVYRQLKFGRILNSPSSFAEEMSSIGFKEKTRSGAFGGKSTVRSRVNVGDSGVVGSFGTGTDSNFSRGLGDVERDVIPMRPTRVHLGLRSERGEDHVVVVDEGLKSTAIGKYPV